MTINLEKSLDIDAPIEKVYERWADVTSYASFMPHVHDVQPVEENRWLWEGERHGQPAQWHIDITSQVPGESIAWRTTAPEFSSTSTVRFSSSGADRTKIVFSAHYPQGAGQNVGAAELAADMETSLQQFSALFGAPAADDEAEASAGPVQGATGVAEEPSARLPGPPPPMDELQHTLEDAATTLVGSIVKAFDTPFYRLGQMVWDMEKQFSGFVWGNLGRQRPTATLEPGTWSPDVQLTRQGQTLLASAQLPGYESDHLHVELRDGQLHIAGERRLPCKTVGTSEEDAGGVGEQHERFHQIMALPEPVDSQQVEARLSENGRLEITLPIKAQAPASAEARQVETTA